MDGSPFYDVRSLITGSVFILIPILCLPSYIRIIYVFATRRKYHRNECFRLMIHIGLCQFFMAPGFVLAGARELVTSDINEICLFGFILSWSGLKLKAVLSLVLALNRLKVIMDFKYCSQIHTVLIACGYLIYVLNILSLLSTWASLAITEGLIIPTFDKSLPYSEFVRWSGFALVVVCATFTIIIYAVICVYLIYRKQQVEMVAIKANERKILIQAVLQFACDLILAVWFHFWKLVFTPGILEIDLWSEFYSMALQSLNQFLVPQVLHLWLIKSLRSYVCSCSIYQRVRGSSAWTKEQYYSIPSSM